MGKMFSILGEAKSAPALQPASANGYDLSQFTPSRMIRGTIPLYELSGFAQRLKNDAVIDIPANPCVVYVDRLNLLDSQGAPLKTLKGVLVLLIHAESTPLTWCQKASPHLPIVEILKLVERSSLTVTFIHACNSGHYELSAKDELSNPYLYAFGKTTGSLSYEGGKIVAHITCPALLSYTP